MGQPPPEAPQGVEPLHVLVDGEDHKVYPYSKDGWILFERVSDHKIWGFPRKSIVRSQATKLDRNDSSGINLELEAVLAWEANGEIKSVRLGVPSGEQALNHIIFAMGI